MEHGTLDTPVEYLCDVAHTQARELGLMAENERAWEVVDWVGRVNRFINGRGSKISAVNTCHLPKSN
jgi:hypothetical protein